MAKNTAAQYIAENVKKRRFPNPRKIREAAKTDPKATVRTLVGGAKELSQKPDVRKFAKEKAVEAAKSGTAKDLAVNTAGFLTGKAGQNIAGPVGAYAGDLLGAKVARKVINKGYADVKAYGQRQPGESRAETQRRANKKTRTLNKMDERGNENIKDNVGWAIGNASADIGNMAGINIPMKGAAAAMATTSRIAGNVRKAQQGQMSKKDAAVDSAKHYGNRVIKGPLGAIVGGTKALAGAGWNQMQRNIRGETTELPGITDIPKKAKKAYRRGLARERKATMDINRNIRKAQEMGYEFSEYRYVKKRNKKRLRKRYRR